MPSFGLLVIGRSGVAFELAPRVRLNRQPPFPDGTGGAPSRVAAAASGGLLVPARFCLARPPLGPVRPAPEGWHMPTASSTTGRADGPCPRMRTRRARGAEGWAEPPGPGRGPGRPYPDHSSRTTPLPKSRFPVRRSNRQDHRRPSSSPWIFLLDHSPSWPRAITLPARITSAGGVHSRLVHRRQGPGSHHPDPAWSRICQDRPAHLIWRTSRARP